MPRTQNNKDKSRIHVSDFGIKGTSDYPHSGPTLSAASKTESPVQEYPPKQDESQHKSNLKGAIEGSEPDTHTSITPNTIQAQSKVKVSGLESPRAAKNIEFDFVQPDKPRRNDIFDTDKEPNINSKNETTEGVKAESNTNERKYSIEELRSVRHNVRESKVNLGTLFGFLIKDHRNDVLQYGDKDYVCDDDTASSKGGNRYYSDTSESKINKSRIEPQKFTKRYTIEDLMFMRSQVTDSTVKIDDEFIKTFKKSNISHNIPSTIKEGFPIQNSFENFEQEDNEKKKGIISSSFYQGPGRKLHSSLKNYPCTQFSPAGAKSNVRNGSFESLEENYVPHKADHLVAEQENSPYSKAWEIKSNKPAFYPDSKDSQETTKYFDYLSKPYGSNDGKRPEDRVSWRSHGTKEKKIGNEKPSTFFQTSKYSIPYTKYSSMKSGCNEYDSTRKKNKERVPEFCMDDCSTCPIDLSTLILPERLKKKNNTQVKSQFSDNIDGNEYISFTNHDIEGVGEYQYDPYARRSPIDHIPGNSLQEEDDLILNLSVQRKTDFDEMVRSCKRAPRNSRFAELFEKNSEDDIDAGHENCFRPSDDAPLDDVRQGIKINVSKIFESISMQRNYENKLNGRLNRNLRLAPKVKDVLFEDEFIMSLNEFDRQNVNHAIENRNFKGDKTIYEDSVNPYYKYPKSHDKHLQDRSQYNHSDIKQGLNYSNYNPLEMPRSYHRSGVKMPNILTAIVQKSIDAKKSSSEHTGC